MKNAIVPYHQQWFAQVPRSTRGATLGGYAILLFGVGGFFTWSALAPLDGAVISPGNFVATSQNKIVQHLEGGIIREILVKEGELVQKDQPLMRLDDTAAKAELSRLLLREAQLKATFVRLRAEMGEKMELKYPESLINNREVAGIGSILQSQREIFRSRRARLISEITIQKRTAAALRERIKGDEDRLEAIGRQFPLIDEELKGKGKLYELGLVRKPEYFALQRARINLEGEQARIRSEVQDGRERAAAAEQSILHARQQAIQQAAEEFQSVTGELKDVKERIMAGRAVLSRLKVVAPVSGVVVKMNYHTSGGIIRPGNDILELLPSADELIIEVNVRPQDIAHVKVGQEAIVRLTALNQRMTPMIPGTVAYVSPDALPNERKLQSDNIYVARVQLDARKTVELHDFLPTPGMPAEVYIKTGQRTFFEYLVRPVHDTMARAFRES
ncbi:MAG: HlyD family type I secretion periplasmic adaptor subunit [Hyphomicrobium sp.]|uniref:HlyD family type I secretion periplasmic adaptor subunit n=1 Tax=Hyphomicrobium sp. TaxID=82 RepID=UPI00132652C7|nr:HlyD family type I secretion periplasmic adaptor subunit [Hyphomicrobium sp.]KAB2943189.1 MAG: HlyD family type I secretion periplasmic adaptor subunit [Hyphomicrobium sp.]MBZ0209181.1 HlyD family type I secretion periplasmic adaptor subunit [Hyphomicrobium sp.]